MKGLNLWLAVAAVALLSGCGSVTKKDLGLVKDAPNEFMVMSRAPLSLPPEYDVRPAMQAQVVSNDVQKKTDPFAGLTRGERAFMRQIGAGQGRYDNIREQITTEMKAVYE